MTYCLVGEKFGRLTVLSKTDKRYNACIVWTCVCDCGETVTVPSYWLILGVKKSCGCYRAERASRLGTAFGQKSARLLTAPGVKRKHLKAGGTNRAKSLLARLDAGLLVFVMFLLSCGVVEAKMEIGDGPPGNVTAAEIWANQKAKRKQVVIPYDSFLQMLAKTEHRDKLLNQCVAEKVILIKLKDEQGKTISIQADQVKGLIETAETQERLGKTEEQINEALQKQLVKVTADLDREKRLSRYKSEALYLGIAAAFSLWVLH